MVYIIGIIGFVLGFMAGQLLLLLLLRERSNKEILTSSSVKWTYGLLNWLVAGAISYICVLIYRMYFP